jgi:alpha-1,3-fucosyltransferase 10
MGDAHDPLILFYTRLFANPVDIEKICCDLPGTWTNDRRRIAEAAAVVFHIPNDREAGDARKYPGQLWVAWSAESSQNYPMMRDPTFMKNFDLRMTYESDADVWAPYLPKRAWWDEARTRPIPPKNSDTPLVMFQSSRINLSGRDRFVRELARDIPLASYGRFLKNRAIDGPDLGCRRNIESIGRYPFCIAFENSICADYVTEKLFDPLWAGTVPVYLGAPNVRDFAPEHSFIDASDFSGPRELAAYLRHLLETPREYEAYFEWRSKPFSEKFESDLDAIETDTFCRLLDVVQKRVEQQGSVPSGQPSLPFGRLAYVRTRLRRFRKWRRQAVRSRDAPVRSAL